MPRGLKTRKVKITVNILTSTPATLSSAPSRSQAIRPSTSQTTEKPHISTLDAFSQGANKGGNIANTLIGAYAGTVGGAVTGGAIGLGSSAVSAAIGAISGSTPLSLGTLLSTAASTGLWAVGGAVVGGVACGYLMNKAGDGLGSLSAKIANKFDLNENAARAIGTVGAGVIAGAMGASVLGFNGAAIAVVAGAAGGGLGWLNGNTK